MTGRWGVAGGGVLGLTIALRLAEAGCDHTHDPAGREDERNLQEELDGELQVVHGRAVCVGRAV